MGCRLTRSRDMELEDQGLRVGQAIEAFGCSRHEADRRLKPGKCLHAFVTKAPASALAMSARVSGKP